MRFGLVHRVMTDALAALGIIALVASGQFSRGVNIAAAVCLALAISMRESWRHEAANRHVDTIAVFALVAAQLGRAVFTGTSILDLLIEFAVGLQIIRVATRKGAAHDQQVIVLALLHLIAGTVVGGGLGYGLCFFGLLVVTPGALVLSHLRREVEGNYRQGARDRTGLPVDVPRILRSKRVVGRQFIAVTCLLSVPILLFTISLFVVFPRVGLSLLLLNKPRGDRMIGFSGKVDLGQIGTLRTDPTIALRVTIPNLSDPPPARKVMHLRGTALDQYDGRSWSQSVKENKIIATGNDVVAIRATPEVGVDPVMRLELEPIDPPVLFFPPDAKGLRLQTGGFGHGASLQILRGPAGEFRYQAPNDRGVHYEVYLSADHMPTFVNLRTGERPRYLQLPDDMPKRIGELAVSWTEGVDGDFAKARAVEKQLRTGFRYDLSSPSGGYEQPLDHFLFESKRGHCEFYSTAMAVMLRTIGIPTRNVTGFVGGSYNRFGKFYAVRHGDAHSWVEAFIEGRGWLTFDPTPPGAAIPQSDIDGVFAEMRMFFEAVSQRWNQHVLGYDLRQQVSLFESLSSKQSGTASLFRKPRTRTLLFVTGLLVVLTCVYLLYRRRRRLANAGDSKAPQQTRDAAVATSMYHALETVMASLGIPRGASTPPLRHAETLVGSGHPNGGDIHVLTERYLGARFGDQPLSSDERRDFEASVRALKEHGVPRERWGVGWHAADGPRVRERAPVAESKAPRVARALSRAPTVDDVDESPPQSGERGERGHAATERRASDGHPREARCPPGRDSGEILLDRSQDAPASDDDPSEGA